MTNIITACFGGTRYANTRPAWLIDHGMVLKIEGVELPETYFVDFANSKAEQATRVLGNADGVVIPDQYFLSNAPQIFAWVYLTTGDSGFTTLQVTIPLLRMWMPLATSHGRTTAVCPIRSLGTSRGLRARMARTGSHRLLPSPTLRAGIVSRSQTRQALTALT